MVEELLCNQQNVLEGLVTSGSTTSTGQRVETISLIFEVKLGGHSISLERLNVDRRIVQMSRSNTHTLLLTEMGEVYSFGSGANGALGLGLLASDVVTSPTRIKRLSKIAKVCAGENFSLFLSNQGMIHSCGNPSTLSLGSNLVEKILFEPTAISTLLDVDIADVSCSSNHVLVCTTDGTVYGWGFNSSGCLGMSEIIKSNMTPNQIDFPQGTVIVKVFAGENASMFIDKFGRLWTCGGQSQ